MLQPWERSPAGDPFSLRPTRTLEQEAEGKRTRRKERYARSQHPTKTPEERREPRINNLLRARPTLTCEKAAEQIDAVFKGALTP
jgi:hypothetical protein